MWCRWRCGNASCRAKSTASAAWSNGKSSPRLLLIEYLFYVEFAIRNADVRIDGEGFAIGRERPNVLLFKRHPLKFAATLNHQLVADPLRGPLRFPARDLVHGFLAVRRINQFAGHLALRAFLRGR